MLKMVVPLTDAPASAETMWVESATDGLFRIKNVPALAYDVDLDDEVEAFVGDDGRLYFSRVVRRSGNVAYRIMLENDPQPRILEALRGIEALSSASERQSNRFYVYNIEATVDRDDLLARLDDGEQRGFWKYESSSDDPYVTAES